MNPAFLDRTWRDPVMPTLKVRSRPQPKTWTVADLYRRFGPIPFERIRQNPPPGSGTVDDVDRLNNHEDRLYELVDGILVEKTVGVRESIIAGYILTILNMFVRPTGMGVVAGADGTIQLDINLVRIPDVSFVSLERLPGGRIPEEPVPLLVPDLVVEVISRSNTPKEMAEKLREYFEKGVRLVWYVRPKTRVVDVYTSPDQFTRLTASMSLDGGNVLPGFSVSVAELFKVPESIPNTKDQKKNGPQPGKKNGPRRGR
jgi:Uma2 family endonuclease